MNNHYSEVDDIPEIPILAPVDGEVQPEPTDGEAQPEPAEPWPTLADYLPAYYEQMGTQGDGLKTYFPKFDEALEGLRGIVIVGGEPGSGKTALALQIGFDTAADIKDARPVLIYSFEMPKAQLVTRLFQRAGKLTFRDMQKRVDDPTLSTLDAFIQARGRVGRAGALITVRETKDFFKAAGQGVEANFDFAEQIRQINRLTEQYGKPPLVIIDSLHEIPVNAGHLRSADLKQKIDHIMLNLRNMCDQTGATFLLISHQSRSGQEGGGLRSFLGSASIEYTVDMALTVALVKRTIVGPDKQKKEVVVESERELIVNKNRYGPKPKASFDFDGKHMDFTFQDMLYERVD